MKFWQRFFSLFSCLVLLFAVFSIPAAAAEVPFSADKVHVVINSSTAGIILDQADITVGDTGQAWGEVYHDLTGGISSSNSITLANSDGSVILPSGYEYTLLLENISFRTKIVQDVGSDIDYSFLHNTPCTASVYFTFSDGTQSNWFNWSYNGSEMIPNSAKDNHSYKLKIPEMDKDILKISLVEYIRPSQIEGFNPTSSHGYLQVMTGFEYPFKVTITKQDKTEGLLSGLLEWVKDIGQKVRDSFDVINSGFANIGTWFAELPTKIWSVMENGIKGLFVPDQQYMESYSNKWEQLLSDRLGAVYQVCDITLNSWDAIMHADETNTITFPLVTIPLPDNASFSFGGYEVKIVPDGFSALATAVKSAVGILCTYLFVNGLMKRYEEVMGVKE